MATATTRPRAGSDALEALLDLTPSQRATVIRGLSLGERRALNWCWPFFARPDQVWRPGLERDTFYLAGRGWGKTRVGAEAIRWAAEDPTRCGSEFAIIGRTAGQRNRDMIYGSSGLLSPAVCPPWVKPVHRKSENEIVWLDGAEVVGPGYRGRRTTCRARLLSGDVPASIRGPGFGLAWTDELPHWTHADEAWENLEFTMREGGGPDDQPRTINTTTPLPIPALLRRLFVCDDAGRPLPDPDSPSGYQVLEHVRVVHGSSYDNAANLSAAYVHKTLARHAGTRLGHQEIGGGILLDVPGALWQYGWFRRLEVAPKIDKIVIGVDPAGSNGNDSAETGIIAAGIEAKKMHGHLLADRSGLHSPREWAEAVIDLYDELGADLVLAETNFGGAMIRSQVELVAQLPEVIAKRRARSANRPIKLLEFTARGSKEDRALTVCGLWEQGRIRHVGPARRWVDLEHQQTHWDPAKPRRKQRLDRLDAAVHAIRYLFDGATPGVDWTAAANPELWRGIRSGMMSR